MSSSVSKKLETLFVDALKKIATKNPCAIPALMIISESVSKNFTNEIVDTAKCRLRLEYQIEPVLTVKSKSASLEEL